MSGAPLSERKQIAIFGKTNAGKSTLFNQLLDQQLAVVSPIAGTTTDPVIKAAELLPFGPVALIDTAGMFDNTELGDLRLSKTDRIRRRADIGIFVADPADFPEEAYLDFMKGIPHLLVFNRCDQTDISSIKSRHSGALFLSGQPDELDNLRKRLSEMLSSLAPEEASVISQLLSPNDTVVMVVPVDSEAPKGRLILPQVQMLRECLDHGVKCMVTRPEELQDALSDLRKISLVITDSQAFKAVADIVPNDIQLTSFSMLLAYSKGNFLQLLDGANIIKSLKNGDRVLMLEGCTHNKTHEDIGRVKIPALIKKVTGLELDYDFHAGYDFPDNPQGYALAVQCGSCMLNKCEVLSRLDILAENGIAVTNYGIILAYLSGILERASQIFKGKE